MITPLPISTPTATSNSLDQTLFARPADTSKSDFAAVIGRMSKREDESAEDLSRRSAEQVVAMAFVQPLLKQLRDTNQAAAPFAPTQGEKQFQSLMDAEVAQRIVHAAHFPLTDRLAHDMLSKSQARATGKTPRSVSSVEAAT